MPIYEEKGKINGQKRYYMRTYVTNENGQKKQITRHNKDWIGRDGYWLAYQEESLLKNKKINKFENMTLSELKENYINYCNDRLKLSSIKKINDNYRLYLEPYFSNAKIVDLSNQDILKWHKWLLTKGLSLKFNRNIHITLVSMLNYACKFYDLNKNVASMVGNFEIPKGSKKKEINFLTVDEFNNFINQEKNIIYKNFFTILFYTGMRLGELWCLNWEDVDFEKNTISINKSYNPSNGNETVPKTNKSNRDIKMPNQVIKSLKEMLNYKTDKYIFGTKKITGTTLRRRCDNNCKSANIDKNIRIHDFRHSFASMCINKDIPIRIISNYLGHENISTTLDIYGHLYPDSQNILIDILNKQDQKQDQ